MTSPWFVTDTELAGILGVPEKVLRPVLDMLDRNRLSGFPPKQPQYGDRRYLPAVREYFDYVNRSRFPQQERFPQERKSA